jgi:cytochrome bd-type quinol oxidase subunit 1
MARAADRGSGLAAAGPPVGQVAGVLFAVGAVSGTILSFELGILWPGMMGTFGEVIGLPFAIEGIAFFTEAIFLGIYLYAWDRLPPRLHLLCGIPIVISGVAGAFFVVAANAWMNQPRGFDLVDGKVTNVDPWAPGTRRAGGQGRMSTAGPSAAAPEGAGR